jgi:hypothetical protein
MGAFLGAESKLSSRFDLTPPKKYLRTGPENRCGMCGVRLKQVMQSGFLMRGGDYERPICKPCLDNCDRDDGGDESGTMA